MSSVRGKAFSLAHYSIFAPEPGYFDEDLERTLAVTGDDVVRVYEQYIKDRPHVATSFVPQGQSELAVADSAVAEVVIEAIVQGAEADFTVVRGSERTEAVGDLDRSVEPPLSEAPSLSAPAVARDTLANGLEVLVIEDHETPLVRFEIRLRGGLLLEDADKTGVASLLAQSMTEGTQNRTPEELEQAIDLLGASIEVGSGGESLVISGRRGGHGTSGPDRGRTGE